MREVKGLELPAKPTRVQQPTRFLCIELIREEFEEFEFATRELNKYKDTNFVLLADALADLLYVVFYACNAYGLDIEPIFNEVHRSNMTKKGGTKRADGKQLKPDSYEPPVLEPLIKEQTDATTK